MYSFYGRNKFGASNSLSHDSRRSRSGESSIDLSPRRAFALRRSDVGWKNLEADSKEETHFLYLYAQEVSGLHLR